VNCKLLAVVERIAGQDSLYEQFGLVVVLPVGSQPQFVAWQQAAQF